MLKHNPSCPGGHLSSSFLVTYEDPSVYYLTPVEHQPVHIVCTCTLHLCLNVIQYIFYLNLPGDQKHPL